MNILGLLTTHHKILIVLEVFYQGEEKSREVVFSRLALVRQGRCLVIFSLAAGLNFLRRKAGAEKILNPRSIVSPAVREGRGGLASAGPAPPAGGAASPARPGPPRRAPLRARLHRESSAGGRGPPGEPCAGLGGGSSRLSK